MQLCVGLSSSSIGVSYRTIIFYCVEIMCGAECAVISVCVGDCVCTGGICVCMCMCVRVCVRACAHVLGVGQRRERVGGEAVLVGAAQAQGGEVGAQLARHVVALLAERYLVHRVSDEASLDISFYYHLTGRILDPSRELSIACN